MVVVGLKEKKAKKDRGVLNAVTKYSKLMIESVKTVSTFLIVRVTPAA